MSRQLRNQFEALQAEIRAAEEKLPVLEQRMEIAEALATEAERVLQVVLGPLGLVSAENQVLERQIAEQNSDLTPSRVPAMVALVIVLGLLLSIWTTSR